MQSVEECVKLISEAPMKVVRETTRVGNIRAKLQTKKKLKTFKNNPQYNSKI